MTNKLFFLHGWSGSTASWDANVPYFTERGFKCYPLKMEGRELPEPPVDWGVQNFAEQSFIRIKEILADDKEKPVLIGHSFGGRQAIYLAAKYPDVFSKIILTNAAGIIVDSKEKKSLKRTFLFALRRIIKKLSGRRISGWLQEINAKLYGSRDFKNASPVMREVMKKVVDLDLTPYLNKVTVETLIIWGENDHATPLSQANVIKNGIKNSKMIVFKNQGHCVHSEIPEEWNSTVFQFISN